MFSSIWAFINDKNNHDALVMIGGGLVAVVGGIWTLVKWRWPSGAKTNEGPAPASRTPNVSVDHGSFYNGGKIENSPISLNNTSGRQE